MLANKYVVHPYSGLGIRHEGGTFGNITIPDGAGRRLPRNTRFVNPAATTVNAAFGLARRGWRGELYIDNLSGERATVVQVGGRYVPVVTTQRPRSIGLRLFFER